MLDLEKWEENYKKSHQIACPHCGEVIEDGENMYPFISMWGEDSETKAECISCEKTFTVEEHVDRTWEVSKC